MLKRRKQKDNALSAIDEFAESLLEEAKRFLEKAREAQTDAARNAYLHAALMLGFCALEAHVNAIADELAIRPEFSVHERALLLEQDVRLEYGEFKSSGLRMVRLDDRILFLHLRISGKALDRSAQWWGNLMAATTLRNQLTHPKGAPPITIDAVSRAIEAIIACLDVVYRAVYNRSFPLTNLGVQSTFSF
jgi:hypothetical protein